MITLGSEVLLKGAPPCTPGTVIRVERHHLVIFWPDLDYIGRHEPDSLLEASSERPLSERPLSHAAAETAVFSPLKSPQNSQTQKVNA
jgi:hypothetical protein